MRRHNSLLPGDSLTVVRRLMPTVMLQSSVRNMPYRMSSWMEDSSTTLQREFTLSHRYML